MKAHLNYSGCDDCKREEKHQRRVQHMIDKAVKVHGDKYDHSLVWKDYIDNTTLVTIICKKHGEFKQCMMTHAAGADCPKCARDKVHGTLEERATKAINKAIKIHGDAYNHDRVLSQYRDMTTLVDIYCNKHQEYFKQSMNSHIHLKAGCPICAKDKHYGTLEERIAWQIEQALDVHGEGLYDHSLVWEDYVNNMTKVRIKCKRCGNVFKAAMMNHISGSGCPSCAPYGFDMYAPTLLYYLEVTHPTDIIGCKLYKIGITNRTVEERFTAAELKLIKVLATRQYDLGFDAYKAEQKVLSDFSNRHYCGTHFLIGGGNTEMFTENVLGL